VSHEGAYVLYWMTAYRRTHWNFALDRAVEWAERLGKPLVILEALRCDYAWASDRFHRFIMDGMSANRNQLHDGTVTYLPYVEASPGDGRGLLQALGSVASVVVTDDFPAFSIPGAAAAGVKLPVRLEAVDSNGLLPMRETARTYLTAASFRRYLQSRLPADLGDFPSPAPLLRARIPQHAPLPPEIGTRWRMATDALISPRANFASLPIDHSVGPAAVAGGSAPAGRALDAFIANRLQHYNETRNEPSIDGTSGLSAYLHFGHISVHEIFNRIAAAEEWSPGRLSDSRDGRRAGWWGMRPPAEAFLDQLVTWRELGFNAAAHNPAHVQYDSLPRWALDTLERHCTDERPFIYTGEEFAAARTHDAVWNAAQTQLLKEGRIHNYLRMLWGKKILEWSAHPRDGLAIMIDVNNRYALDGRDPNSYSGIFWCLGRYDRPWFPERPIFGTVRYMSSAAAARKFDLSGYLSKYGRAGNPATALVGAT